MPPPSSGGVHIIQILNILEPFLLTKEGPLNSKNIHRTASAMQLAFADRAKYLGDIDFVKVPIEGLVSKKYARELRDKIKPNKAKRKNHVSFGNPFPYESDETTHFTIMDGKGNVISSTQTINGWFGSGIVTEKSGIVLNNEMDDFSTKIGAKNLFGAVGGEKNLVEPGKRPLSSMSPTIIFKNNKPIFSLGTPSGTRILTCVAQVILNFLEYKQPLFEAVSSLRYHHQWYPDEIRVEEPGFSKKIKSDLEKMGYKINLKNLGCRIQAISLKGNLLHGVSDPRGEGHAIGL